MKLVSWNVNGVRAVYQKGFKEIFNNFNADIFCIQETKMQEGQLDLTMEGYHVYLNSAERKGYSGTAVWTKIKPISVSKGIGIEEHEKEGRVLTLEYNEFYLVNVYTPNSKRELERLDYRVIWENEFRKYVKNLEKNKPVILCGDKTNRNSAGFTDEERREFQNLLNENFVDTFRVFYPDKEKFSWWSYFGKAREKNVGWRIDYFVVSEVLKNKLKDAEIHDQVFGSDHCPVSIDIEF